MDTGKSKIMGLKIKSSTPQGSDPKSKIAGLAKSKGVGGKAMSKPSKEKVMKKLGS